jgi:DNA-directed RNA polymerase specialized sigma24 family protein
LIRSGLRLRYVFDLRTAHSGNDRRSRIISSYRDSMRALLGRCMISDARFARHRRIQPSHQSRTITWIRNKPKAILPHPNQQIRGDKEMGPHAPEARNEARLNEVMETCDRASREVIVLRLEGFSWKEIGKQFDISSHAAEARFSKALDHARKGRVRDELVLRNKMVPDAPRKNSTSMLPF